MLLSLLLAVCAFAAEPVVVPGGDWVVEDDARPAVEAAIELLRRGQLEQAAAALSALDAASEAPQLSYLHALALYEDGKLEEAATAALSEEHEPYGPLLNLQGLILTDQGQGEQALEVLRRAEQAAGTDRSLQARVLLNRGLVEADSGRFAAAEASLTRAAVLAREVGDTVVAEGAVNNLARVASLTGRGGARDVLGAVVEKLRRGDVTGAQQALDASPAGDRRATARQALARASILRVQGQMDEAMAAAQESLRISREAGLVRERLAALGDIATLHIAVDQPALARTSLDEALATVEGTHFKVRELGLRIQSGLLAADQEDAGRAAAEAERAGVLLADTNQPVAAARLDELRARVALLQDDRAGAERAYLASYTALEGLGYEADAARVAVEAVQRTAHPEQRAEWKRRALARFDAAGDPSGRAYVELAEGLLLASLDDVEHALESFVRAAEAAEDAGPRAARARRVARENAAVALAALGHSSENAASASELGVEEVVARREAFDAAAVAYEAGRAAYDEGDYGRARTEFQAAREAFEELGETANATASRRALAWAAYQDAVHQPAAAAYPYYEEIEQEALRGGDEELALRARASRARAAGELGLPDARRLLREAAEKAEEASLDIVAGQLWADVAVGEGDLAVRATAARRAAELLPGEDLGTHALYSVAVDAYNDQDYSLARRLTAMASARPGGLAEAIGQLEQALIDVGE